MFWERANRNASGLLSVKSVSSVVNYFFIWLNCCGFSKWFPNSCEFSYASVQRHTAETREPTSGKSVRLQEFIFRRS